MEERTLTDEGREISNWYQLSLLKCNPDKFQSISVESGPEMKPLGVTFDKHLKCTSHLDELPKRVI